MHSRRNANVKNAGKASAANVPSATQIANAPEASAAAAGNAANAAAAANGHANHKPAASVEAAEEADFRDVPPAGRVVPAVDSAALRVVPVALAGSCGCSQSWLRSTRTVTAKSPPRKSRQHLPRSRSWTKTRTAS